MNRLRGHRLLLAIALACALAAPACAAAPPRPNIVVILADDMGFSDIGCYGGEIQTPHLDKLAAGGVRMTQFYNMARCCPTRASLLTGLYPHQAGVGAMCQDLGDPAYRGELNDRCVTIAEALGAAGYDTAMLGKWHLAHLSVSPADDPATLKPILNFQADAPISPGGSTKSWPVNRGFGEMWGTIAGVQNFYGPWSLVHNETPIRPEKDFFYTEFITDKSVALIEQFAKAEQRKPFFLYVAHTAPHWPIQAREADIRKYEQVYRKGWETLRQERYDRLVQLGIIDANCELAPRESDQPKRDPVIRWEESNHRAWEVRRMATYAAMVDAMDKGVGKIVAKLNETGLADDTLILFLSDNGACAENVQPNWYDVPSRTRDGRAIHVGNDDKSLMAGSEDTFMSYGPLWANVSNTPFRGFKHYTHEGGIATPLIVHCPARIARRGELERSPGHVIDILPTCLDAAGVAYPKTFKGNAILPADFYRYFPNKRAIVLTLYDQLSAEYALESAQMPRTLWRHRFVFALETSLRVLGPHRNTLKALIPVLVGDTEEGLFAQSTEFSRLRVQKLFQDALIGAKDSPTRKLAEAMGRLLYLVHLAVILWWLLDKSPQQRATSALIALIRQVLPSAALTLRLPPIRSFVLSADELFREALLRNDATAGSGT